MGFQKNGLIGKGIRKIKIYKILNQLRRPERFNNLLNMISSLICLQFNRPDLRGEKIID